MSSVRTSPIPDDASPLFDDDASVVVGWQSTEDGWITTYAIDGTVASRREKGLETPLIDPIDLIIIFCGLARVLIKGAAKGGTRLLAGRATARLAAAQLSRYEVSALLGKVAAADNLSLLFSRTVLNHMRDQARFVPVQIIKMAIKYGERTPDPQKVAGVFRYMMTMSKNGKTYQLEVLLREVDRTVLHVLYK